MTTQKPEIEALLTEIEDWGKALLAEHDKRLCDVHPPVVQSSYVGKSLVQYAERIRTALEARDLDDSFHGDTPWDTRVHSGHPPFRPVCNERRLPDGQWRGACLNDDGSER